MELKIADIIVTKNNEIKDLMRDLEKSTNIIIQKDNENARMLSEIEKLNDEKAEMISKINEDAEQMDLHEREKSDLTMKIFELEQHQEFEYDYF